MDQRAGDVPFFDGGVQVLRLSTTDAADEVGEMIAARLPTGPRLPIGAEPALIAEAVLVASGQVSGRSVKDVADRIAIGQPVAEAAFVVRDPVPDFELHDLAMTARLIEFECAIERVLRLLVVIEHEVAADGGDATRERDAEPQPRGIDLADL